MGEPKVIEQGKPVSKYFKVFVPPAGVPPTGDILLGDRVVCRHPVTMVETMGKVVGTLTEPWLKLPDWICLDTYGLTASKLKEALEAKFPEFRGQDLVRILIIKKD